MHLQSTEDRSGETKLGARLLAVASLCIALAGCDLVSAEKLEQLKDLAQSKTLAGEAPEDALPKAALDDRVRAELRAASGGDAGSERTMDSIAPEDSIRVYYQFVDDRGRVRFVERLAEVPTAWRGRIGFVEMSSPPPLTPGDAQKTWKADPNAVRQPPARLASAGTAAPKARSDAERGIASDIILYSAEWCGYCQKAKRHLDGAGIAYEERDVDRREVASELTQKTGRGGVPVLDVDGKIFRGYSKESYDQMIREL